MWLVNASPRPRRGNVIYLDDGFEDPPQECDCNVTLQHSRRPWRNGGDLEKTGWYVIYYDGNRTDVVGPACERYYEADRAGRRVAAYLNCKFIPASPEQIDQSNRDDLEYRRDQRRAERKAMATSKASPAPQPPSEGGPPNAR
jgi:hypothetical protein